MKADKFQILFVCSGNSCRSPLAEGLLKSKIPAALAENVEIQSAGTLGIDGAPATAFAIRSASDLGADIAGHWSQGVTDDLIEETDIIFAMARNHYDYLQQHFPEMRENIFFLTAFDRAPGEEFTESINDPIGANLKIYQACAAIINSELERILPRLEQLIRNKVGE